MIAWIKKLFEAPDGLPDEGRVAAMSLVASFIGLAAWSVIVDHRPFDPQQYGIGIGGMMAGIGALFGFRKGN